MLFGTTQTEPFVELNPLVPSNCAAVASIANENEALESDVGCSEVELEVVTEIEASMQQVFCRSWI
uniref:Uncharacterized protein n=1 Tax=Arundo donax TaxID=35708 RepID=A0A0A9BKR8_ARUDO